MSFVFYVFLLFIDEIQLGVCQTAVLDIAVFSTVFRIVFLYRCRYVWIICLAAAGSVPNSEPSPVTPSVSSGNTFKYGSSSV